jgi:serine/threonine protein kinase
MDSVHLCQVKLQVMGVQGGALMGDSQNRSAIGKYQLIASLGQGGMARVYLALVAGPAGVNKLMVVKVLSSEMLHGPEGGLELFWDEARLAARLVHPNIVHTYEVGEADGNYFLAMEYLDGQTLRVLQVRAAQDPLPNVEELRIVSEVARGLQYAHELRDFHGAPLNVVHRDVSPQNVFVTYDGQVKLIDFGIAKTRDAGHETRAGLIKGKLNYIAPEQLRGDPLDRRADVFALGAMLWETVAGRRFAGGANVPEVAKVHKRIKGEEPNIRSVRPDVSEELATIIDRAIHIDREQRWHDAAAFADALDAYIDATGKRPGAKSLAAWMQPRFAQDRAAMHKVIDERVQLILKSPSAVEIEKMPNLPVAEGTGSGTWPGAERSGTFKGRGPKVEEAQSIAGPVGMRPKLRLAAIGAAVTLLVAGALALFMPADAVTLSSPAPIPGETPVAATANQPSSDAPAPGSSVQASDSLSPAHVTVQLTASPPSTQVTIDGAAVTIPFSGEFTKSAALHRIEATSEGYKPSVRLVSFNRDQTVNLVLAPMVEASSRRSSARPRALAEARVAAAPEATPSLDARSIPSEEPAKPAAIVPGADIGTARSKVGHGQIDTDDPYANGR